MNQDAQVLLTQTSCDEDKQNLREDTREQVNTAQHRSYTLDGLEVDGEILGADKDSREQRDVLDSARPDDPVREHGERDDGDVTGPPLPVQEKDSGDTGADEQADDDGGVPCVRLARAELEREQQLDGGRGKQGEADEVELRENAADESEREGCFHHLFGAAQHGQERAGNSTYREIDVETCDCNDPPSVTKDRKEGKAGRALRLFLVFSTYTIAK